MLIRARGGSPGWVFGQKWVARANRWRPTWRTHTHTNKHTENLPQPNPPHPSRPGTQICQSPALALILNCMSKRMLVLEKRSKPRNITLVIHICGNPGPSELLPLMTRYLNAHRRRKVHQQPTHPRPTTSERPKAHIFVPMAWTCYACNSSLSCP